MLSIYDIKKIIYFSLLKFLNLFLLISVNIFFLKNKKILKKNKLCVPDLNTYGYSILFFDYLRLLKLEKKKYFIIIPRIKQQIYLIKVFFKKKEYIVYDESVYNFILFFLSLYYKILKKENKSFLIDFNYNLNQNIKKKICTSVGKNNLLTLFIKYNKSDDHYLEKYKNLLSKNFVERYIRERYSYNKSEFSMDHMRLISQRGNFILKKNIKNILQIKKNIFKNLNVDKKYICLFLRYEETSYTDLRSTENIKKYLKLCNNYFKKKGYQVVLMGSYNKYFNKIFIPNIINYRNSEHQNPIHDFVLTNYCEFAICNLGGFAVLPSILGKPNLCINSSCFGDNYYFKKTVYHPKNFIHNGIKMTIFDIMKNPIFFEQSKKGFEVEKVSFKDISYSELFNSVKNFLKIAKTNKFSDEHIIKRKIKKNLTPLHLLFNFSYKSLSKIYLDSQKI